MAERNVGSVDRVLRAAVGTGLLWAGLGPFAARRARFRGTLAALLGAVLVATALTGVCSVYRLLGVSTAGRGRV